MQNNKKQRGFTLIELLVVIAIIGILTTLITSNLTQAQSRARDARRKTDLKVIAQGLEMYYSQNNTYPANGGSAGQFAFTNATLTDSTGQVYIKNIPKDPTNASNYEYFYCVRATSASTPNKLTQFNLFARLENANDAERFCNNTSWANGTCEFTTSLNPAPTCGAGSAGTSATLATIVDATHATYVVTDP